jgi:uncharacterized protein (DUF1499 family)
MMEEKLKECPASPNCVSTQTAQKRKKMAPISFTGRAAAAKAAIHKVVKTYPRTALVKETDRYLHFTFKSRVWGFIDDVEFLIDPEEKLIHFRSASRAGTFDLGVNRRRMKKISVQIAAAL